MGATIAKSLKEVIACPSCVGQLILTQEGVLVCPSCLLGYRVFGDIPDLALSRAISLKKQNLQDSSGWRAVFQVVVGNKQTPLELFPGHCVILGRALSADPAGEVTVIARQRSTSEIDSHTLKLIEKYLTRHHDKAPSIFRETLSTAPGLLGDFKRDADYLLDDAVISKRHALLYHDEQGVCVVDLVSKNGTYLNGREIEHTRLRHHDILSLGGTSLRMAIT